MSNDIFEVMSRDETMSYLAEITTLQSLNLAAYDSYKVAVAGGYDYGPALNKMVSDLPSSGGALLIPSNEYDIYSNVNLNGSISLIGMGFNSILKVNGASLITDDDASHSLFVSNIKLILNSNNVLLNVKKTVNSGKGYSSLKMSNVWLHSLSADGTLLYLYGVGQSDINHCWFMGDLPTLPAVTSMTLIGIDSEADGTYGMANININNCQLTHLYTAINIVSNSNANIAGNCGFRLINNMIIGVYNGIIGNTIDALEIEEGMIDMAYNPVQITDVISLKIRNGYFTTDANSVNTNVITIKAVSTNLTVRYLDISHNYLSSYASSANQGDGINATATGERIQYGVIANNQFKLLKNAITLNGTTQYNSDIRNLQIHDNSASEITGYYFNPNAQVYGCKIYNNYAENNVANFLAGQNTSFINNDISRGNVWATSTADVYKYSDNHGKIVTNGDGTTKIFQTAHNCMITPNWGSASIGSSLGTYSVSYSATNIIVTFDTAPPVGTNNVVINWEVKVI